MPIQRAFSYVGMCIDLPLTEVHNFPWATYCYWQVLLCVIFHNSAIVYHRKAWRSFFQTCFSILIKQWNLYTVITHEQNNSFYIAFVKLIRPLILKTSSDGNIIVRQKFLYQSKCDKYIYCDCNYIQFKTATLCQCVLENKLSNTRNSIKQMKWMI